jgi:hypothetical protein
MAKLFTPLAAILSAAQTAGAVVSIVVKSGLCVTPPVATPDTTLPVLTPDYISVCQLKYPAPAEMTTLFAFSETPTGATKPCRYVLTPEGVCLLSMTNPAFAKLAIKYNPKLAVATPAVVANPCKEAVAAATAFAKERTARPAPVAHDPLQQLHMVADISALAHITPAETDIAVLANASKITKAPYFVTGNPTSVHNTIKALAMKQTAPGADICFDVFPDTLAPAAFLPSGSKHSKTSTK